MPHCTLLSFSDALELFRAVLFAICPFQSFLNGNMFSETMDVEDRALLKVRWKVLSTGKLMAPRTQLLHFLSRLLPDDRSGAARMELMLLKWNAEKGDAERKGEEKRDSSYAIPAASSAHPSFVALSAFFTRSPSLKGRISKGNRLRRESIRTSQKWIGWIAAEFWLKLLL